MLCQFQVRRERCPRGAWRRDQRPGVLRQGEARGPPPPRQHGNSRPPTRAGDVSLAPRAVQARCWTESFSGATAGVGRGLRKRGECSWRVPKCSFDSDQLWVSCSQLESARAWRLAATAKLAPAALNHSEPSLSPFRQQAAQRHLPSFSRTRCCARGQPRPRDPAAERAVKTAIPQRLAGGQPRFWRDASDASRASRVPAHS